MTAHPDRPAPEQLVAINEALRREAFHRTLDGETLHRGQWIKRYDLRRARLRQGAADLWHALEFLVLMSAVALVGLLFLVVIDAII